MPLKKVPEYGSGGDNSSFFRITVMFPNRETL